MKRHNEKLYKAILLSLFSAIIIVMSFTPLGYLKIGLLEATLLMIPVAIGAVLMGPAAGAILGFVFGITSFIQCFGMSPFGAQLLMINPFFTFVVCVIPRTLEGLICALVSKALSRVPKFLNFSVSALCCALSNTVLFMGLLMLLFGNSEYILGMQAGRVFFEFIFWFVGIQGLVEIGITAVVSPSVAFPLYKFIGKSKTN